MPAVVEIFNVPLRSAAAKAQSRTGKVAGEVVPPQYRTEAKSASIVQYGVVLPREYCSMSDDRVRLLPHHPNFPRNCSKPPLNAASAVACVAPSSSRLPFAVWEMVQAYFPTAGRDSSR